MSEKAAQRLERKWQQHETDLRRKALADAVRTPEGRALLWWLLSIADTEASPFTTDPHTTAFRCGEQNVGLRIKAELIDADPAGYVNLLKERADGRDARRNQLDQLRRADNSGDPEFESDPASD